MVTSSAAEMPKWESEGLIFCYKLFWRWRAARAAKRAAKHG
jgi:hypothetical protein